MNATAWIALGFTGGLIALTAWALRELEKFGWQKIEKQRQQEIRQRLPRLTVEQIIARGKERRSPWTPPTNGKKPPTC